MTYMYSGGWKMPHRVLSHRSLCCFLALLLLAACSSDSSLPTAPAPVATMITVSPGILTFETLGDSEQLNAVVLDQNGGVMVGAAMSWSSSDQEVATIFSDGLVTAWANGTATVTVTSGSANAAVTLNVHQVPSSVSLSAHAIHLLGPSDTVTVAVSVLDSGGSKILNSGVQWSSNDETVLTVEKDFHPDDDLGLLRALASGSATVSVAVATEGDMLRDTLTVSIAQGILIGPDGGQANSADSIVSLALPSGSLTEPVFLTIDLAETLPPGSSHIPGTAFDLGPTTVVFNEPVQLTISYDPNDLLPEIAEEQLGLHQLLGGQYLLMSDNTVDSASHAVSATIEGVGLYLLAARLSVTTASLPSGAVGASYVPHGLTASGGTGSYTWSLVSGELPAGLALSTSGVISGMPTVVGTSAFTVQVEDGLQSAEKELSLAIQPCSLDNATDTDEDRLPDCVETNTGTFLNPTDTGTDPNNWDTDGDGISDGDEVLGTEDGLDLPAFGVSPLVPSILIEYDWFDDSGHTHRPTATQLGIVTASFAAQGIEVIHDYGQGPTPFVGGNFIADADGNVDGLGPEFYEYKSANFDANRNGYFHYALHPHRYNDGNSSGLAEINGDDLINATLGFYNNDLRVAGTIQHELGHNLNLRHGGNMPTNRKPNYNSVMNYNYQFYGVDNNCTPIGDGVVDYSHGVNPDLDENDLDERNGICGSGTGWDWNEDGDQTDVHLVADITRSWRNEGTSGDGSFDVLRDHDDWSHLSFSGLLSSDGASFAGPNREVAFCPPPPELLPE